MDIWLASSWTFLTTMNGCCSKGGNVDIPCRPSPSLMLLPSVHTITKVFGGSAGTQVHRDGGNRVAVSLDFCLKRQAL